MSDTSNAQHSLEGRTAVITGGGQGIGRATSEAFAAAGATVAVVDVNGETADATVATITAAGGRAGAYVVDVTSAAAVEAAFAEIAAAIGAIDVLVNNAGGGLLHTTIESSEADWHLVLNLNLCGVVNTCRAVWRPMIEHGGGVILNASSQSARRAMPGLTAYNTAKAAVTQLTKCLAVDGAPHGIRANTVHPGWVLTPAVETWLAAGTDPEAACAAVAADIPMGRMASPADVAGAYLYLASSSASYVTGTELTVDGGSALHR